jgi:hypothetical protein
LNWTQFYDEAEPLSEVCDFFRAERNYKSYKHFVTVQDPVYQRPTGAELSPVQRTPKRIRLFFNPSILPINEISMIFRESPVN